jgi:ferrochelatase
LLARLIASRRSGRIADQYSRIGGKSPIGDWTRVQASALSRALAAGEAASRASGAPPRAFRPYIAFRYAPPLTASALSAMAADGVTRAVAFPQYPQFSCTTSGSSLNHLWREAVRLRLRDAFAWSVLDRWHDDGGFVAAAAARVAAGLARWPAERRDAVVVVFSAHSVPMLVVNRGDAYVAEIAATAAAVMAAVRRGVALPSGEGVAAPRAAHVLAWQSNVGFLPWMGPQTAAVLAGLGAARAADVLVVPIAFTSDHVETRFEIDVEYAELAHKAGIARFERAPSLNDEPLLATAQAALLREHLDARTAARSPQYALNCAGCTNPACRTILNPAHPYSTAMDAARGAQAADVWPTQADVDRLQASEQPSA